jgi:hypothetical protein
MIALIATAINAASGKSGSEIADATADDVELEDVETETTLSDVVDIYQLSDTLSGHWTANFSLLQSFSDGLDEAIVITHRSLPTELTIVPTDFLNPTGETEVHLDGPSPTESRKHVATFDTLREAVEDAERRACEASDRADARPHSTKQVQMYPMGTSGGSVAQR